MIIYGAGMAGLLTAHMLRRFQPVILEAQSSLPNNHEALLRFRTDAVSRATGIPFKRVEVTKCIQFKGRTFSHPDIRMNNLYSHKCTGEYHARSISDMKAAERFIAPPNFIELMAKSVKIQFSQPMTRALFTDSETPENYVISTVPMPVIMDLASLDGGSKPDFRFRTIWSVQIEIQNPEVCLYQTIYYPEPDLSYYRASITGNRLIIEFSTKPNSLINSIDRVVEDFGISIDNLRFKAEPTVKEQKYGKLLPIDNSVRKAFILALTDQHRVYSIGRFATWRQILMDDVVQDVKRVEDWISNRDTYGRRLDA